MNTESALDPSARPGFEALEPRVMLSSTVDLTIPEIAGFARVAEPVTSGVPLPDGAVTATDNIRLMQGAQEVPAQFKVLARWDGLTDDPSKYIKWVLVDFQADVSAGASATYTLEYGTDVTHGSFGADLVTDQGAYHAVDTGPMSFDVSHSVFNLFNDVTVNGVTLVSDSANNNIVLIEDETGAVYTTTMSAPTSIEVEENGPLKAIVHVRGDWLHDGSASYWTRDSQAEYTVYHAGGSSVVTVNQNVNPGQWVSIGTYTFNSGTGGYVQLNRDSEDPNPTVADAVRLVKTGGGPEYTLDNFDDTTRGADFEFSGSLADLQWWESVAVDEWDQDNHNYYLQDDNGSSYWTRENGAWARWTQDLPQAGDYEVYVWYGAQADPSDALGPEAYPNTRLTQPFPYVHYNARITVYKNKDYAKVEFIMENDGSVGFYPECKYTSQQEIFIEDMRLNTQMIDFGAGATVHTVGSSYGLSDQDVEVQTRGIYPPLFNNSDDTFPYNVDVGAATVESGFKYGGWMEISNTAANRNVAVGVKHFWQKHPVDLAFTGGDVLSVAMFPAGSGYPLQDARPHYAFDGGRHYGLEMLYRFSTGARDASATEAAMQFLNDPLFAFAPSDYYFATDAWPNLAAESVQINDPQMQAVVDYYEDFVDSQVDENVGDGETLDVYRGDSAKWFGSLNFGDQRWAKSYCSNHYDWTQGMFLHMVRKGDPLFWRMAQEMLPHERDVDQYWGNRWDTQNEHKWNSYLSRYEADNHNIYAEKSSYGHNAEPVPSHNWNGGLVLGYFLTGDTEALRAAEEHYKYAENRYGTQSSHNRLVEQYFGGYQVRVQGWTITGLLNIYRATGKQEYLDLALAIGKNDLLYGESLAGSQGVYEGPQAIPQPGFYGNTSYMPNTVFMYAAESVTDLYIETGDTDLGNFIARIADFDMDHNFYHGDFDANGNYHPLVSDYNYDGDGSRNPDVTMRGWFHAPLIATAYQVTGDPKYLNFARQLAKDSVLYWRWNASSGPLGNGYIDPDTVYPISYGAGGGSTVAKEKGWLLRSLQPWLDIEASRTDFTPPADITDLASGTTGETTIEILWTAPGDDGMTGTALRYDIRYSTIPINAGNWDTATQIADEPDPLVAGTPQSMTVTGLSAGTTYYFAVKTQDVWFNESGLSNVLQAETSPEDDTTPPAAVADLAVVTETDTTIQLTWTAPGDDGMTGTATSYDLRYSTSPINDDNDFNNATQATGVPAPQPAGSTENFTLTDMTPETTYYIAIKAIDNMGNVADLSNVASTTTRATPQGVFVDFETPGDEAQFVNLSGDPGIARVPGHGGWVLELNKNNSVGTVKFSPGGSDFHMAAGTFSADLHMQYYNTAGPAQSLVLKDWTDSMAQYGGYVVTVRPENGTINVWIGASKVAGAATAPWNFWRESQGEGHTDYVQGTAGTYTQILDSTQRSIGWFNVQAVMTIVNDTDVQIDVTITEPDLTEHNISYTDSAAAAVVDAGKVGLSVYGVWSIRGEFDNFDVYVEGAESEV
ncbi:MAG: golvesin C-terminal-like domain-containing protein, partial [Planctomycetota bacterium]